MRAAIAGERAQCTSGVASDFADQESDDPNTETKMAMGAPSYGCAKLAGKRRSVRSKKLSAKGSGRTLTIGRADGARSQSSALARGRRCVVKALPESFTIDEFGMLRILPAARTRVADRAYDVMRQNPKMFPSKNPPAPWTGFREGAF